MNLSKKILKAWGGSIIDYNKGRGPGFTGNNPYLNIENVLSNYSNLDLWDNYYDNTFIDLGIDNKILSFNELENLNSDKKNNYLSSILPNNNKRFWNYGYRVDEDGNIVKGKNGDTSYGISSSLLAIYLNELNKLGSGLSFDKSLDATGYEDWNRMFDRTGLNMYFGADSNKFDQMDPATYNRYLLLQRMQNTYNKDNPLQIGNDSIYFNGKSWVPEIKVNPNDILNLEQFKDPLFKASTKLTPVILSDRDDDEKDSNFWSKLGNTALGLTPDLVGIGRLLASLRTNNKVAEEVKKSLNPVLRDTYERYSPVTGSFGLMLKLNNQGANILSNSAKPFTSDASLAAARMLEGLLQANNLLAKGFLQDNEEIKRTRAEALARQEDNMSRRSAVANFNRESINKTNREISLLEATRLNSNWQSLDNYLSGVESRLRNKIDTNKQKRLEFESSIADDEAIRNYNTIVYPAKQALLNWTNGIGKGKSIEDWNLYDKYIRFLREASNRLKSDRYARIAKLYNYNYINPYDSEEELSWVNFKKQGGELNLINKDTIPKFLQGGGFRSLFTIFKPVQTFEPLSQGISKKQSTYTLSENSEEKGKLTEKELFNMLKDIDGLPNEMHSILTNLIQTFLTSNLTGVDVDDLSTTYLSNLYQLKIAQYNKTKYDKALEKANENGSLQEPAISPDGKLIVLSEDGEIRKIELETYFNNENKYSPLTVSNIAYLRANDSNFNNNQSMFDVINNSMGYESFQKLVDSAKATLGTTDYTKHGLFSTEGKALAGLNLINSLLENDKIQALGSVTAEGLYKYEVIDKNQLQQINYLTSYITTLLPNNAKTWASWKLRNPDKNKATKDLVLQYLLGTQDITHSFDIDNKGTSESKSKSGKDVDPNEGFWRQVQSGKGGNESRFNILVGKGRLGVDSKFYGMTPGIESNCSLGDYLIKSGAGSMIKNPKSITFGDVTISDDSFNDVMVNASSGLHVTTLPVKDGKVYLEAVEAYDNFVDDLKKSKLIPGSMEYNKKVQDLLSKPEYTLLSIILQSNGKLKPENSGMFLVLEGITSNKAYGLYANKKYSFDNIDSDYIETVGDDKELYRILEEGLSNKERGKYKLDYNDWYDLPAYMGFYDKLYKGLIYIQLSTNPIDAMNADKNDIKESTAYEYEEALLIWKKRNNQGLTDSDTLRK